MKEEVRLVKTIGLGKANYGLGTDGKVYRVVGNDWFSFKNWKVISGKRSQEVIKEINKFLA